MSQPNINDYEILEKLGTGSYSIVNKCYKKATKEYFAIKCVEKARFLSKCSIDNIITEIKLLKTLKHKHIVEMKEFFWDEKNIYIVMEYCNAGDLSLLIKKRSALPEPTCKFFLRQLTLALQYMRSHNVSHFDLKPQNLLLTKSPHVQLKVADFGFAQHLQLGEENTSIKGSPLYMAPEILLSNCYDAKADLWSIGVILYECLFGRAPYSSKTLSELLDKIKSKQKIEIPKNAKISFECEDLLNRLLQHDPAKRIDFAQYFEHDFLDLKHAPSDENFEKALSIVTKAVEEDNLGNYKEAYHLYCDSLQYFVPIITAERDATKKQALRSRVQAYLQRAEEIKSNVLTKNSQSDTAKSKKLDQRTASIEQIKNALTPSLLYQQLYTLSASSPILQTALEIGRQAELYAHEGKFNTALESLKASLGSLVTILSDEPKGQRRDLLHQQIMEWMKEAESMKSLLSAQKMDDKDPDSALHSHYNCCVQ